MEYDKLYEIWKFVFTRAVKFVNTRLSNISNNMTNKNGNGDIGIYET